MDDQDVERESRKPQHWVDISFFFFHFFWNVKRGFRQHHEKVHLGYTWIATTSFGMPARGLFGGTLVFFVFVLLFLFLKYFKL